MLLLRRDRPLRFVVSTRWRNTGSTVMRGDQLAMIARQHHVAPRVDVVDEHAVLRSTGADLFLTKNALKALDRAALEKLGRRNRLLFDVVDENPPVQTYDLADALVAASVQAFTELSLDYPTSRVVLVNHHVDPRIDALGIDPPRDRVRIGYFGESLNVELPASLTDDVELVAVDTSSQSSLGWLGRLRDKNVHYAVRRRGEADLHKPFLKGFVAAHVGAPVLIQRSEIEASYWLGPDYPFWVEDGSEAAILSAVDTVREAFGGPTWREALDRMAEIRHRTRPERIAAELAAAVA